MAFSIEIAIAAPTATTYHINAGHAGATTTNKPLVLPSVPSWRVATTGINTYPIIAEGKVFIVSVANGPIFSATISAHSATTSSKIWGPVALGSYYWAAPTY